MTSKDALNILLYGANNHVSFKDFFEAREKIEKDLEVLNILKKHIYSSDVSISIIIDDLRNYDDFIKIKGWLENE